MSIKMKLETIDKMLSIIGGFLVLSAAIIASAGIILSVTLLFQANPLLSLAIETLLFVDSAFLLLGIIPVYLIQK